MRPLVCVLAGVVLALASAACQAGTTSATDLKVGDCFDHVSTVDADGNNIVADSVVDCASAHDAEVYLVIDVPAASGGAYPGDEAIGTLQQSRCDAAFTGYVGKAPDLSSYTIDYERPDIDSWSSGDHTIDCLIENLADPVS